MNSWTPILLWVKADYFLVDQSNTFIIWLFFTIHTGRNKWLGLQPLAAPHSSMAAFVQSALAVRFSASENVAACLLGCCDWDSCQSLSTPWLIMLRMPPERESSFGCCLLISLCLEAEKLGALVIMSLTPVTAHSLPVFCKWLILSESA